MASDRHWHIWPARGADVRFMDAAAVCEFTPWDRLIDALQSAFRSPCEMPMRSQFDIGGRGTLLLMPAWNAHYTGVKVVQVFPENSSLGMPAVSATYLLSSAMTGEVLASLDGEALTARRTAAASALASRYLSRADARCLLVMGAGRLAFDVVCAHAAVRPIDTVLIWARRRAQADALAGRIAAAQNVRVETVVDLPVAIGQADIISTVTTSRQPILGGQWVRQGTHVDLIGGFTPAMREADDELLQKAVLFADLRTAVLREAGDYLEPLSRGVIREAQLRSDLFALCAGAPGREDPRAITVFKSVGLALEDLAAATLAWHGARDPGGSLHES